MCKIDELFCSKSLDEKTDPIQRFIQALDEYGASGDFRKIIVNHFSASWSRELGSIASVEAALKCALEVDSLPDKLFVFIQTIAGRGTGGWFQYCYSSEPTFQFWQKRYPSRVSFTREIATQIFPDSPYGFFRCFLSANIAFSVFLLNIAPHYYGDFHQLKSLVFNDKQLQSIGTKKRHSLLWSVFDYMVQWDCTFVDNLMKLFTWEIHASVPTQEVLQFNRSFEYLCSWVESDAQSQDFEISLNLLDCRVVEFLNERKSEIYWQNKSESIDPCTDKKVQTFENWADKWLDEKRYELSKTWCCNVKPGELPSSEFDTWAHKSYENFLPLCQEVDEMQVASLIAWGIDKDLKKLIAAKGKPGSFLDYASHSILWYISAFRKVWRNQLICSIDALPYEEQLCILGRWFGGSIPQIAVQFPRYVSFSHQFKKIEEANTILYEFTVDEAICNWWNSLLRPLPKNETFPKKLYPQWTLKALTRFGRIEELAPFADKSLAIVRGAISTGDVKLNPDDIDSLIRLLEKFTPEKALRHILFLLRSSSQPFSTENLDIDRNSLLPKSMSEILKEFTATHFNHESRCHLSIIEDYDFSEYNSEELNFLISMRAWFAAYCLSRLKLRKGKKGEEDSYDSEQVVEQSPLWRKAYLRVLDELGVDLHKKVHQTINYIKRADPEKDVRETAKACYKSVRREHNKSETVADIYRSLTAAYWWLLLAQRESLGLSINKEEAVKTRRRMLRRP